MIQILQRPLPLFFSCVLVINKRVFLLQLDCTKKKKKKVVVSFFPQVDKFREKQWTYYFQILMALFGAGINMFLFPC